MEEIVSSTYLSPTVGYSRRLKVYLRECMESILPNSHVHLSISTHNPLTADEKAQDL